MLSDDQRCCHAPPGPGLASRTRWSMPRWRRKYDAARPACPAPITTESRTGSMTSGAAWWACMPVQRPSELSYAPQPLCSSRAAWQPRRMTTSAAALATRLLELHHTGSTLVLPNVWDAWSAKVVAEAGFGALSIGSHPLADSLGQGDNEDMTLDDALDGVRRICSAVPEVPVTADMEAGYGTAPGELVERLVEAGAVGLNIEDTVHSEGGRMRSAAEHADYIGALRQAADAAGVDVVVNARTDAFITKDRFDDPLAEALTRLRACEEVGARCVY